MVREVSVVALETKKIHPELPAPVTLQSLDWQTCGKKLCVTPRQAEKDLANKIEVATWMRRTRDIIHYYRNDQSVLTPGK